MAIGGQFIKGLFSRLFGKQNPPQINAAGVAAQTGIRAIPLEIPEIPLVILEKVMREKGHDAAKKALKSSGMPGFRNSSEGKLSQRADKAMGDYINGVAEENYTRFLEDANTALTNAIQKGDEKAIEIARHQVSKIKEKISNDASAYLAKNADKISGWADQIGYKVKNGGIVYRSTAGMAGKHPVYTTAVAGTGLYGLSSDGGEVTNTVLGAAGSILSTAFNAVNGAMDVGATGLSYLFEGTSEMLQYTGIDPKYANIAVGLGTFFALKAALNVVMEQSGLGKRMPGVAGLGVLIVAGVMAYKIADSAGAFESSANINDKTVSTATLGYAAPVTGI